MEGAATNHPAGDQREETLHLIEPGTAGGREVKMEPLSLLGLQPALHLLTLVGAIVVQDQMDFLVGRQFVLQVIQEFDELATAVAQALSISLQRRVCVDGLLAAPPSRRTLPACAVGASSGSLIP